MVKNTIKSISSIHSLLILINKIMATNKKTQMSIINEEGIKKALEAFKSSYKENKKQYEEENVKIEDVVNLTKGFSGKSAALALTVIVSIMIAMPPRVFMALFMALMDTAKSISKAKFIEAMKEIFKEKVKKGADNDIDN